MKLALVILMLSLAGCAWPSKKHPWCAPQAKFNHQKQAGFLGWRCGW